MIRSELAEERDNGLKKQAQKWTYIDREGEKAYRGPTGGQRAVKSAAGPTRDASRVSSRSPVRF